MTTVRRGKAMPTDGPTAKFLYTIIKQLDLKSIDWSLVASQLDISNGHAARMRYSRFRQQMEGITSTPRTSRPKKTPNKGKTASCKAGLEKEPVTSPSQPVVKPEPQTSSAYEQNPYIKTDPYSQTILNLADIPHVCSQSPGMSGPSNQPFMNLYPPVPLPSGDVIMYSAPPPYPGPVIGFERQPSPPHIWAPIKTEPTDDGSMSDVYIKVEQPQEQILDPRIQQVKKTEVLETSTTSTMAPIVKASPEGDTINNNDAVFVFECLKNLDDSKNVDLAAVAGALQYTNVASVGNRFRAIRKRYGFNKLDCTFKGPFKTITQSESKGNQVDVTLKVEVKSESSDETMEEKPTIKGKKRPATPRKRAKANAKPVAATEGLASPRKARQSKGKNDKVDFTEVAKECNIVTSGAASKRLERLRKGHAASTSGANNAAPSTEASGETETPTKKKGTPGRKRKSATTPAQTPTKKPKSVKQAAVDSAEALVDLKFGPGVDGDEEESDADDRKPLYFQEFVNEEEY
ncbi:hypothetical protein FE257_011267 [Aspergillus nanangensis]|uniref:Myb-like DNA-binding domain-containing protein n=1 Tax=Aspergillus nanangensis TaxID=2582783 RepID=A0AAD4CHW5_ASPNN|nr:hypothetical protein FE257_011267 [Aspergillus nanangensis]